MIVVPRPLVSVIVPAYNAERYLADAVRSVLGQTWHELELIVVDDGSTDGTGALADQLTAADPRARVIHKRNGGPSSARNAGLAVAKGELLCFLDADDVFLPDKIERQAELLELFPGCDLVFSDHYVGDAALTPLLLMCKRPPFAIEEILSFRNWFAPMSPLLRSSLAAKIGGFDEELASSEDWDYWIRASQCGALSYLPGPVAVYRSHPGQLHHDWARTRRNSDKVVLKHRAPGSEAWGNSLATIAMITARRHWATGRYLPMMRHLARYAWHARSRRRRKRLWAVLFSEIS
jgi:glycosyltransferase involved in cell wall biosynthesis